jgi:hypothetical protein
MPLPGLFGVGDGQAVLVLLIVLGGRPFLPLLPASDYHLAARVPPAGDDGRCSTVLAIWAAQAGAGLRAGPALARRVRQRRPQLAGAGPLLVGISRR